MNKDSLPQWLYYANTFILIVFFVRFFIGLSQPFFVLEPETKPDQASLPTVTKTVGNLATSNSIPVSTTIPSATKILSPTKTDTPTVSHLARISCAEGIFQAAIRRSPGFTSKNDREDVLVRVPCGELVELLGRTQQADSLTWWNVTWGGYTGWMADHTGSGRTILIFEP